MRCFTNLYFYFVDEQQYVHKLPLRLNPALKLTSVFVSQENVIALQPWEEGTVRDLTQSLPGLTLHLQSVCLGHLSLNMESYADTHS